MRAEDILPDDQNHGRFGGVVIRKGTVAAFLASARTWLAADTAAPARLQAERDIVDSLPALRALGLFELLAVRDERLRALVDAGA